MISLYAKGMTTGDIQAHLAEIYGTDTSRDRISRITDAVVEDKVAATRAASAGRATCMRCWRRPKFGRQSSPMATTGTQSSGTSLRPGIPQDSAA